jgi:hypothetical protein
MTMLKKTLGANNAKKGALSFRSKREILAILGGRSGHALRAPLLVRFGSRNSGEMR